MKKSFQLSAVAIAIAASSSAMAGVSVNGGPSFGPVNSAVISVDGLSTGNTVTTSIDGSGVNVNAQLGSSSNVGGPSGGTVTLPTTGTPNSVTNVAYDTNYSRTETQDQTTQVYTPQKLEFTSATKNGTSNQTISRTADVSYDNSGDLSGLNNIVQTNDTGWVFDNASATTLAEDSVTLGKKTTGADNALTITKTDASGSATTEVKASGISTTGTLNVGGNTTLNAATVNGLLTANNGAAVTGGLTADTATVNGLLSANGGAAVTGGLTADTATVNGALTAGASTLDSLNVTNAATVGGLLSANGGANVSGGLTADTATVNGMFNANGGANVLGGLTADTATITGLLTTDHISNNTLASNRIQAPMVVLAGRDLVSAADGTVEVTNNFTSNGTSANQLIGKYNVSGTDIYQLHIFENGVATEKFYVDNAGQFVEYTGDVSGIKNGIVAPIAGGTSRITSGTLTTGTVKNVATDKNLTYSEQVTTQDATSIDATFDRGHPALNTAVGTGTPKTVEQSVVNGIIATNTDGNVYGVEVSKTDANGTAKTTVTAGTISTGTVTADTLIVDGTNVKDTLDAHTTAIAGLDTRVTANETAITNLDNRVTTEVGRLDGRVDAVDARVTANETAITTLDGRVTTEVGRLDDRIDTVAADTLATANTYTDTKVGDEKTAREAADTTLQNNIDAEATTRAAADTALNTRVTNETAARQAADDVLDARVTTNKTDIATNKAAIAKEVTDRQTAITAEANARIAGDAATLKSANTYTDTKTTETLAAANAYTNTRVDQLNSRVDDVQKTAYRGIAIALAAQQAVPSIQPGQVAVFGGVGHYEGETAGSIGVVTAFTDRISASGALGFASGNEFGGRVGVAYVFGGK